METMGTGSNHAAVEAAKLIFSGRGKDPHIGCKAVHPAVRRCLRRRVPAVISVLLLAIWPAVAVAQRESSASLADLRRAAEAWRLAFERRDLDGIGDAYADGAYAMYPRSAPVIGREANREGWARFFALKGARHPLAIDTVFVSSQGDLGVVRARWGYHREDTTPATDLGGEVLILWVPDRDGRWVIQSLAANMYTPMPGTAPRP